jgi:peptidyl-prolyl cis-trans isomerase A (cyclophilin A)
MAGPGTRTTQLFINYANNSGLDAQGFAPFAKISSGMDTARLIYNPTPGDSNGISQLLYTKGGNAWLLPKYPNVSLITSATFLE